MNILKCVSLVETGSTLQKHPEVKQILLTSLKKFCEFGPMASTDQKTFFNNVRNRVLTQLRLVAKKSLSSLFCCRYFFPWRMCDVQKFLFLHFLVQRSPTYQLVFVFENTEKKYSAKPFFWERQYFQMRNFSKKISCLIKLKLLTFIFKIKLYFPHLYMRLLLIMKLEKNSKLSRPSK